MTLAESLVLYARITPGGKAELRARFTKLFAEIQLGRGKTLIETDVNGTKAGWKVSITVEESFQAHAEALKILNGRGRRHTQARIV